MVLATDKVYYFNTPSVLEFYLKHKDNFYRITNGFEKINISNALTNADGDIFETIVDITPIKINIQKNRIILL